MSKDNKVVRVNGWGFEGNWSAPRRGGIPLLGYFLIILGLCLAASSLWKEFQVGVSAFFLAVGILLVAVGIRDKSNLAFYCGTFIAAISLSDVLSGAGVIHGSGWGTLFLGLALIAVALYRSTPGRRLRWTFWIGAILVALGSFNVANSTMNFGLDRLIVPGLIVLLGLYVINRRARA